MTTTTGKQDRLTFNVSGRHAGLRLAAIGGLCAALALGFVASVEQTSRQPASQATVLTRAAAPATNPVGTAMALR
jgi:hypothetical protein